MTSIHNDEHIFKSLYKYMFTTNNISRIHGNVFISPSTQSQPTLDKLCNKKQSHVEVSSTECSTEYSTKCSTKCDSMYTPKQNDKLFWGFYILLHGKVAYDYTSHIFETEKKFKIQSAEKLRDMKAMLRQYKLKYSDIEKELVSLPKITIKGLHALCILYKVSITYVSRNVYYILGNTNEDASYKNCVIIADAFQNKKYSSHTKSNLQIGLQLDATDAYIKNICHTRIRIKNYNKPMLSIASYTLPILHEMANILNINIYDDSGKKKLKKLLYQDVSEKII